MKSLAFNIKHMKNLEANPDVIQYVKACKSVGSGHVQTYLSKIEESKKLKARLSDVDNDIKVHKAAASNLLALAHENYQCPVLDDDQIFVSPCDNMDSEEIDKVIENGKVPSIKAIVVMPAIDTPQENGKVPSIKAIVVMPAIVTPQKRKHVAHTPSMDNDSLEIVTRAKGLIASRAKSICLDLESGKKNEE